MNSLEVYAAMQKEINCIKALESQREPHYVKLKELSANYQAASEFHSLVGKRLILTKSDEDKDHPSLWGYAPSDLALKYIKEGKLLAKRLMALDIKITMLGNSFEVVGLHFEGFIDHEDDIHAHWTLYTQMVKKSGELSNIPYRFRFIDVIKKQD